MDDTAGDQASTGPGGVSLILVVDNNPDTARDLKACAGERAPRPGRLRDGARHPRSSGLRRRADPHLHRAAARDQEAAREVEGTAFSTKPIEPRRLVAEARRCAHPGEGV